MKRNYENLRATDMYRTLSENLSNMPFSFVYNGKEYKGFSPEHFTLISKNVIRSGEKETQTFTFVFFQTLEVTLILTHYFSHGVTEWTVWLENTSDKNSGVIEELKTELSFEGKFPVLKGIFLAQFLSCFFLSLHGCPHPKRTPRLRRFFPCSL